MNWWVGFGFVYEIDDRLVIGPEEYLLIAVSVELQA